MKFWPFSRKKKQKSSGSRSYGGALLSRLTADWITSSTSIDSEIRSSMRRLRDRARQLERDNDHAANVVRAICTNVVGSGVRFQAQVRMLRGGKLDSATNALIESKWEKWCRKNNCHTAGTLNFEDIEKLVVASWFTSGEIFVRIITQPMGDMRIPMALEILEADLLDEQYNCILTNGNTVKMGVERNQWGRPIAYHFFTAHPGDDGFQSISSLAMRRIRVLAEEVIHLFDPKRPDQTRGVTGFASSMQRLHQMAGYEEAEVITARAYASSMGFIESPEGELQGDGLQNGERVTDFQPGVFKYLMPGEKVTIPQLNRPSSQFEAFMRGQLRGLSAGVGVSYESISRDYSQSNYSSTRQALIEDRDMYKVIQAWLIRNFHQIVYEKWLDLAVLSGELQLRGYELKPDFYKVHRWLPRGWAWVDPAKEVAAYKEAVRCGFMTLRDVISQSGGDLEETLTHRAAELEICQSLDLVLDTDPAQVDLKGQVLTSDPNQIEDQQTAGSPDSAKTAKAGE